MMPQSQLSHAQGDELPAVLVADSNNLERNGFTSALGSGDKVSPSQEGVPILSDRSQRTRKQRWLQP